MSAQERACERKRTACRSGRLLPDGVGSICAPAVQCGVLPFRVRSKRATMPMIATATTT